jgi:hypothetical protein
MSEIFFHDCVAPGAVLFAELEEVRVLYVVVQGDWKRAPTEEADKILALIHSQAIPINGVWLYGSENEKPLPSRKALAELNNSSTESESLAGFIQLSLPYNVSLCVSLP